ncbi:hypothetical protein BC939DRAFT_490507 [Gamsiella multidivaricata]|uniref:uncharacterized protein n=1 Tax=Gamsiella multidivaricata TaxID=101098 RepID=UPI00221EAFB9|nr:uncharacterized protein BC939DRAFT_490507 [Gamsiella multidivaricata]KAG0364924.1 hypothetical protein BGZ54_007030 [Gamsiella multidivaricata]KAI7828882.1 hypothetical protein BC939DRAFT_490507 [Gamsiella multidivaricata]
MSHQRSKSTSSLGINSPPTTPAAISIPRQRSMSTSLGMATSPIAFSGTSYVFNNPMGSPSSTVASASSSGPGSGTTPPTNLSNNIPSQLNRRFSASFTNPLNVVNAHHPTEERRRRSSLFGSSPPVSRSDHHSSDHSNSTSSTGISSGIGELFRKFSTSGRSGAGAAAAAQHPMDTNESGPPARHFGSGPLSNAPESNTGHPFEQHPHLRSVEALEPSQQDKNSRPSTPMGNMILNGQMLD